VSWDDAVAFCHWVGGRLPTEAEWERAARIGQDNARFVWGNEFKPEDNSMANTWDGRFPDRNTAEDGYVGTAPVGSFPANRIGLHDMAGNVWEWTADRFDAETYTRRIKGAEENFVIINPEGPERSTDPRNPLVTDSRVQKGGSFLCNASYCASYRPSARMASTPDSGLSHLGFRPVRMILEK
jgi:formylglycine-generating enzyme required for sulfatase activity